MCNNNLSSTSRSKSLCKNECQLQNHNEVRLYSGVKRPRFMIHPDSSEWIHFSPLSHKMHLIEIKWFVNGFSWWLFTGLNASFLISVFLVKLLIATINIIIQLKLTQTLECFLQLWKGFFERMKSETTEAEVIQLSKPVLTFQTPAYDVFSVLLLLIQQRSLSVWLRITYSILPETQRMSFSPGISI